nr:uncharacterized protein LOC107445093 [Parasteatoda tepidariorum]
MWEICLNECVLCLCSHQRDGVKQVFAGLADGTLAVVENVQGRMPKPEVFYVVIGSSPVTCLQLVGRRLWCACGPNVTVLSARTLDVVEQFQASSNNLDYIYRMLVGDQGVWITLRGSSILQLWDPYFLNCRLLYDIRENYSSRSSKVDEAYTNHARITSILPLDNTILVGTADGTFIVYDVIARKSPSVSASNSPQPPENPESGHAKQIQERLQKLLLEQQSSDTDGDLNTRCSNSPNLTPSSNVSRRSSASDRSSRDSIGSVGSDPGVDEESRKSPALLPPEVERSPRLQRGIRKSSFAISAPIAEEKETKFDEEEEEQIIPDKDKLSISSTTTLEPTAISTQVESQPQEQTEIKEKQETVTQTQQGAAGENVVPELEKKRKSSDPKEFYRFRHIDAGDLASSDGGDKIVSALEFQDDSLKSAKKRYQSLSAEDIPTWVAQEKPQPVISARGDVTFEYKSKLPSIKAFIRREANELASFLKRQQHPSEEEEVPIIKSGKCPLFSIRPPTLDIADHQLHLFSAKHFPIEEPVAEPPVESTFQLPPTRPGNASLPDSRRSSGVPEESALPPSYLASDEEFLSTAQFNDLLQLQDWTRTSRKGSDTASNISMNSAEVPFAFELHLRQMLKISDKPVKSLLKTRVINPEGTNLQDETIIVSCAGHYNDDEAVLKWTRDKSSEDQMWSNDVIIDVCPLTHTMKPSPFARVRLPRRASVATTTHGSSESSDSFVGRASIESGIAKVQQILSRVSERT